MKKVKHIFVTFLHSFVPQDIFYPKLLHTRLDFSVKYYICILSLFACIFTCLVFNFASPIKLMEYKNSVITSLNQFPKDVSITLHNGILDSNLNKPLFLWMYQQQQPLFVVLVHPKDTIGMTKIPLPLIFFGKDHMTMTYRDLNLSRSYDKLMSVEFSQTTVQTLVKSMNGYFPSFIFFFYLFLFMVSPALFMGGITLSIVISSLITYILFRTFIPYLHFKKCLQAGMHGTHFPLIITILLYFLFPSSLNIFIISAALIFVFTLVATYEMYSGEINHSKGR